ncbi:MAG: hypothetical protein ACRDYB_01115 [Acidimicrobiales bacterium]
MPIPIPDPLGGLSSLLGSGVKTLAGDAFQSIAKDFSDAASAVSTWLWKEIGSSTAVQLGGSGFDRILAIVMAIAVVVGMGLFLVQIITSVLRRDSAGLARAAKGLLVAFLGGAAAIGVTNILLSAVDALSNGVVQVATGGTVSQLGNGIMGTAAWESLTNPAAMLILALIVIAAVVFIWAALVIRKLLIIVAAVFAPAAFAGSLADISTGWVKKWIEGMAALIASKLILVIMLVIGYYVLTRNLGAVGAGGVAGGNPTGTQAVTQVATGGLILLLAGFAPWVALKTVHFTGDHMAELHAHAGSATAGASTVIAAPQKMSNLAAQGKSMVGSGSGAPGPTGPTGTGGGGGSASAPAAGNAGPSGSGWSAGGATGTASATGAAAGAAGAGAGTAAGAGGGGVSAAIGGAAAPFAAAAAAASGVKSATVNGVENANGHVAGNGSGPSAPTPLPPSSPHPGQTSPPPRSN